MCRGRSLPKWEGPGSGFMDFLAELPAVHVSESVVPFLEAALAWFLVSSGSRRQRDHILPCLTLLIMS